MLVRPRQVVSRFLVTARTKSVKSEVWPLKGLKGLLLRDPEGIARKDTQSGYKYKKHVREILQRSQKVLALFCIDARPLEKGMKACRTQK